MTKSATPRTDVTTTNCMTLQNDWVNELLDQACANEAGKSYLHNTFDAATVAELCEEVLKTRRELAEARQTHQNDLDALR